MDAPLITIYSRILSNIDHTEIEAYSSVMDMQLNFGSINAFTGGESSYIMEFDIWNNEPAQNRGMLPAAVQDATNCVFSVWEDSNCRGYNGLIDSATGQSYVYARNITNGYDNPFVPIKGLNGLQDGNLIGNIDPTNFGVLSGVEGGDHTKIQVKIIVSPNNVASVKPIYFSFQYNYE